MQTGSTCSSSSLTFCASSVQALKLSRSSELRLQFVQSLPFTFLGFCCEFLSQPWIRHSSHSGPKRTALATAWQLRQWRPLTFTATLQG